MSNEFFNASNAPATGSSLSSATQRAEFAAIEDGFDKLPTMASNGNEVVTINSGATGMTSTPAATLLSATTTAATTKATPVDADELPLSDSAASYALKKLTWANLKATLKTYFDAVTTTLTNKTLTSPTINGGTITGITDITVEDGGTGRSTGTTAYALVATGTTATGAQQTLASGATTEVLVGGGASALPVWTTATGSGAPVRATSPTLVTPVLGVATGTSFQGIIGNVTPAAGTFTTLTSTGNATLGDAEATDTHAIKGATTLLANSASAALTITQTGAGNAFVVEDSASTDSTPFVVTADGITLVGDSTARTIAALVPSFQVSGSGTAGFASIMRYSSPGAGGANLVLASSRGSAPGTFSAVTTGDGIGGLVISGDDGTSYVNNVGWARWSVESAVSTGVIPSYFHVAVMNAAGTPAERFRIASDGTTTLGGTSTAPALSVIPVASQTRWVTITGSNGGSPVIGTSAGDLQFNPVGQGAVLTLTSGGANTVNLFSMTGKTTGNYPVLSVTNSSDTNTGMDLITKGNAPLRFYTEGGTSAQVHVTHTASANRCITLTGSNGGNPTIGTSGGNLAVSSNITCAGNVHSKAGTATPAGGDSTTGLFIGSSVVGIYIGSGAPTISAAQGSIYLRTDGGASTRIYSNNNGSTGWSAITSA